nr:DUF2510 domain-containing protein [Thermoleophilaceae bacterium]
LHHAATELAFVRRHVARRRQEHDEDLAQREATYAARLEELRAALPLASAVAAPATASAPQSPLAAPSSAPEAPAAWYPDPYRQERLRWWDGWRWTEHTAA